MTNGKTDGSGPVPGRLVRHPQNFYGGLTIICVSLFVFFATRDLEGMTGYRFGPGTAPRLIAGLFGATGLVLVLRSFFADGPKVKRFSVRGSFFVVASVLFFAAAVGVSGIVVSGFITIIIASAGSPEFNFKGSIIWAAVLTAFCATVFVGLLSLPLPLWPRF